MPSSAAEADAELGEVGLLVAIRDAVKSTANPSLGVADQGVDQRERLGSFGQVARGFNRVRVTVLAKAPESAGAVRHDGRARPDKPRHGRVDRVLRVVRHDHNAGEPGVRDRAVLMLDASDGDGYQRLCLSGAAADVAGPILPAEERVIHLNGAFQHVLRVAVRHRPAERTQHQPRCLLADVNHLGQA